MQCALAIGAALLVVCASVAAAVRVARTTWASPPQTDQSARIELRTESELRAETCTEYEEPRTVSIVLFDTRTGRVGTPRDQETAWSVAVPGDGDALSAVAQRCGVHATFVHEVDGAYCVHASATLAWPARSDVAWKRARHRR